MSITAAADRLAAVAVELAVRVRDESPEANAAWLAEKVPTATDRRNLCIVLAAAIPIDQPWRRLTAWTQAPPAAPTPEPARRTAGRPKGKSRKQALKPCGTRAAALRHRYHGEQPCDPCVEAEREYDRNRERNPGRSA